MDAGYYDELIRRVVAGRKLVVCADVLVAAAAQGRFLRALGARRPFLVAGSPGTGVQPTDEEADWMVLDTPGATMMESIWAFERALLGPPPALLEALDRYDPGHEALVIGTIFMPEGSHFGRRCYGTRPAAWAALEDKTVIDDVFDDAHITRAPRELVAATHDDLLAAHRRIDRGDGSAIAGDARDGWWGGAQFFRRCRTADDVAAAAGFFSAHCDRVRVMPFLDGIPCSVHGMVLDRDVIAFRPVEMLTLRTRASDRLLYAGVATYWDPPDAERASMRGLARRLGSHLRERVAYRGVFTVDGVMTQDGFLPTEVNARVGAGLSPLVRSSGVNVGFLSRMVCEREVADPDFRPSDLEALVVEASDAVRGGGCYSTVDQTMTVTREHPVVDAGGRFRPQEDGETKDGSFTLGPSGIGGFVSYVPEAARIPVGASFAPTAVRALAYADEHFATGLGPLEPAPDVRR